MKERIKELAQQAEMAANKGDHVDVKIMMAKFADLIRADERENFVAFIQEYPHWLGDNAKREIIAAIRARGNT